LERKKGEMGNAGVRVTGIENFGVESTRAQGKWKGTEKPAGSKWGGSKKKRGKVTTFYVIESREETQKKSVVVASSMEDSREPSKRNQVG